MKDTLYSYDAYGLRFEMPFECPELAPAVGERAPDVVVRYGEVPEKIESEQAGAVYEASSTQFLLRIDQVAHYLVDGASSITIAPHPGVDDLSVRVYLLGSCLAALLHHRGVLALHASAILTDKGAVLFMGASGRGKSTTLNEFLRRGYRMLSDDVVGIVLEQGQPVALPGYPQTKLWADAAGHFDIDTEPLDSVYQDIEKFAVPIENESRGNSSPTFVGDPAPLAALYSLTVAKDDVLEIVPLERMHAFRAVLNCTYRRLFLQGLGMQPRHFELATQVAASVPIKRVRRPADGYRITELGDLLESDFS